ncbi:MAG TPA: hypothetical protein VFZ05_01935 [Nitrososphaera sp.]
MRRIGTDNSDKEGNSRLPEVIVDFECEGDSLFIVIANVGFSSAHRISIRCDKEIRDFRGKQVTGMEVFRRLEFMPPGRKVRLFVNGFAAYLKEKQPLRPVFTVTYFDRDQRKRTDVIRHNLAVFRGLVTSDETGKGNEPSFRK